MLINARLSLASLILLAAPIGCSNNEVPPASLSAVPQGPLKPFPADSIPPKFEVPTADPAVVPASVAPADKAGDVAKELSGEIRGQANQAAGEVRGSVDQAASELRGTVDRVGAEARKAVEGAKKDARDKARTVEDEVKKDAREIKKQVIEGLLGEPKN